LAARARRCAARTRHFELIATQNGALRASAHIRSPKIDKNYRTRAAPVVGFPEIKCFPSGSSLGRPRHGLFFHWTTEDMKYDVPRPAKRSFADPSGNIFGSKLCTGATIQYALNLFRFILF
jgi:hypothetical protein